MTNEVILVNDEDVEIGTMEKLRAHQEGKLHRAFSIFIFNSEGKMLIHRRAAHKYHSGGLWTNACCSHPGPGDDLLEAANRRLQEEMGIICSIKKLFEFTYRAQVSSDLIEHEYDHVFAGVCNDTPKPDPDEVDDWKWIHLEALKLKMEQQPDQYTSWFKIALPLLEKSIYEKQIPVS